MTMGERLRRAREEAGLSQRQVCGDQITRNQLSQLEHDRVGPSVETLRYLAGQLGRPVSYFLDETPSNLLALQEARIRADPGEALRALEGYQPDGSAYDDLAALLESILCLAASDQAAAEGRLPYAKSLAARGREALTRCAFPAGDLLQGQALYRLGRYQEALELLRCAEVQATPEEAPPIWQLLEACCRESGDYRGAYEYAAKLRPPAGP